MEFELVFFRWETHGDSIGSYRLAVIGHQSHPVGTRPKPGLCIAKKSHLQMDLDDIIQLSKYPTIQLMIT